MIVRALVRPADDLHRHIAVLEHLLVADRRLEQVLVLLDPVLEVEGVQSSARHGFSFVRLRPVAARTSALTVIAKRRPTPHPCYLIRPVILSTIGLGVA